ncbi:hypothetical protein [Streptomyces triticagri]|nr:hypothetical protein [Streptomyces triticagri]
MRTTGLVIITATTGAALALTDAPTWSWAIWSVGNATMWSLAHRRRTA